MTPSPTPSMVTSAINEGVTPDGWLALLGTILGAIIAAGIAVHGYRAQQQQHSRTARAAVYSEALRAVDDYLEAPYRVRRRDGTATSRMAITNHVSDIQSRLAYHRHLLQLHAPTTISTGYDEAVRVAKADAGPQMTAAWKSRPTRRDRDVPLVSLYEHAATTEAIRTLTELMRADAGELPHLASP